jgi:hypothetical protein
MFCCCIGLILATQIMLFRLQVKPTSGGLAQLERPELSTFVAKPSVVASQTRFRCETTRGDFEVELRPDLAPYGAIRDRDMVDVGFFNQGIAFFRVNNWLTQFGADQLPGNRKDGDPFTAVISDPKRDVHPDLVVNNSLTPWARGTFALIGET